MKLAPEQKIPAQKTSDAVRPRQPLPYIRLGLLTGAALAIHGYHLGVEDSEIFIPAARKLLHPSLYPYGDEFFLAHAHMSLFSPVLAWTARLTHLSMDWTLFLWYLATLFAMLLSCWMLAAASFRSSRARWCSLLVVTAALTMPATNTGLLLMDPYLTARSFSTPLVLVALVCFLDRRYALCAAATVVAAAFHPQMAAFFAVLAGLLWLTQKFALRQRIPTLACCVGFIPATLTLSPAQGAYKEALYARDFFFLANWSWYDWIGMLAPLAFLAWFAKGTIPGATPQFRRVSFALIPFGLAAILVAAVFSSTHDLDMLARFQPLRCFHLITMVFVIYLAGVIGEYATKDRAWTVPLLSLSLACGMFFVARQTYPSSPQVEWPWSKTSSNAWVNTLFWIRANTPEDAVFAVDSRYFKAPGVDVHGFRSISERSALADYYKDGGVAAMFPRLAPEWKQMSNATYGLDQFRAEDFRRVAREYPVTWTVIHGPAPEGVACPYQKDGYTVCRIPGA